MMYLVVIIHLLFLGTKCLCNILPSIQACHEAVSSHKSRIIWTLVDVTVGSSVSLQCTFCNERDDFLGKVWRYLSISNNSSFQEIINDYPNMLIHLNHTLKLSNFSNNDRGIYYCQYYDNNSKRETFIYILDSIITDNLKLKKGSFSQWEMYRKNYLDFINSKFEKYVDEPFSTLRNKYNCNIQVFTVWTSWGICKSLNNKHGIRRRIGKCRIQLKPLNFENTNKTAFALSYILNYGFKFQTPPDTFLSCKSIILHDFLFKFGRLLNSIPDYEALEACYVQKTEKKYTNDHTNFEIKKHVAETSFLVLNCIVTFPGARVLWFKNKKILDSNFRNNLGESELEPHITIDSFNTLHLQRVTKNEEGNYSCFVDGKLLYKYNVKIVSKTALLNQEFFKYSLYLGFVLSLTLSCYCAGICVAWHRRSSFVDPLK